MRLGVLGGSFNPIHYGHIEIAQAAMAEAGLSQILLMVAADPPHKQVAGGVKPEIRLEMARLAEETNPALKACALELNRQGKSYTVDTAQALHGLYPDQEICWLIGGDMLLTLEAWHDPQRLLKSLHFLVAGRPIARASKKQPKGFVNDMERGSPFCRPRGRRYPPPRSVKR